MTLDGIIAKSRALPEVTNYFNGKCLPGGFTVPSDILLYCHDSKWPHTIASSRYMLILPFVDLTYRIDGRDYPVNCGQAVLVKPFLPRSVPQLHRDYLRLIISFVLEKEHNYLMGGPVMAVTPAAWAQVDVLLDSYARDEIVPAAFALTLLLGELSRHSVAAAPRPISPRISEVMSLVNQYLGVFFGIKDIAARVGLSASYLRRKFRTEVGTSLGDYIDRRRLGTAQQLLMDTTMSIEAVACSCGYSSIYSFSRFFKQKTGLAPLRFRRRHQKAGPADDAAT